MTFRANFLLECVTSLGWMSMNLAFYLLIFTFTPEIGRGTGWTREPFFAFVATGLIGELLIRIYYDRGDVAPYHTSQGPQLAAESAWHQPR